MSEESSAGTTRKRAMVSMVVMIISGIAGMQIVIQAPSEGYWPNFVLGIALVLVGLLIALENLHRRFINGI